MAAATANSSFPLATMQARAGAAKARTRTRRVLASPSATIHFAVLLLATGRNAQGEALPDGVAVAASHADAVDATGLQGSADADEWPIFRAIRAAEQRGGGREGSAAVCVRGRTPNPQPAIDCLRANLRSEVGVIILLCVRTEGHATHEPHG